MKKQALDCETVGKENVCSLKVSKKVLSEAIGNLYNNSSVCETSCEQMVNEIWTQLNRISNPDCKVIRQNNCDRLALTEYEGGEPVKYTISDSELADWMLADQKHSWFPVDDID